MGQCLPVGGLGGPVEAEQHAVRGLLSWGGGALWQTEVWWGWGRDRDTQQSRYDRTCLQP